MSTPPPDAPAFDAEAYARPRAMRRRVRGFSSPQSWFVDLTAVDLQ
jgi:hypothetical protein